MEGFEMFGKIAGTFGLVAILLCLFIIVCNWKIFIKAGKPGWASIVPIYNSWVMYDIIFGNGLLMLICFIPIVGGFFSLFAMFKFAKCFGKGIGFAILLILLPFIAYPMLAFGSANYIGPQ